MSNTNRDELNYVILLRDAFLYFVLFTLVVNKNFEK